MTAATYFLKTKTGFYAIEARDADEAKRIYCKAFGFKKTPGGSVISTETCVFPGTCTPVKLARA